MFNWENYKYVLLELLKLFSYKGFVPEPEPISKKRKNRQMVRILNEYSMGVEPLFMPEYIRNITISPKESIYDYETR